MSEAKVCECGSATWDPCTRKAAMLIARKDKSEQWHMCKEHAEMNLSWGGFERVECPCHKEAKQ